jgi:hypothetical protein
MNTKGSQRERIDSAEVDSLQQHNVLIADGRRERPRWFDGRFLTAGDLTREQSYILSRQADLGRAAGAGVAAGLEVDLDTAAGDASVTLRISAGHGITPAGELVLLENALTVRLDAIPESMQLSARFGLGPIAREPQRGRSGLHVLALRPVEFSANAGGRYPTTITGARRVEDEDIVEATAVTLVPWPEGEAGQGVDRGRAAVAHAIFVEAAETRLPANVLPLAMVALDTNTVRWIDMPMVRRELGSHRGDLPGLSPSPRALRLAHLQQFRQHLADLLQTSGAQPFAAQSVFPSLPPAGPMPPGVIDPRDMTQRWLPASVEATFTIIPEDELPALLEDTLLLPPIDFTQGEAAVDATAVLFLAPVGRHDWNRLVATLESTSRDLQPAAANQIASRRPLEALMRLRRPGVAAAIDTEVGAGDTGSLSASSEAEWRRLARSPSLWYVRRSRLARYDDLAGVRRWLAGGTERDEEETRRRVADLGLGSDLDGVLERATPRARVEITSLLSAPRLRASRALTAVAIGELKRLDQVDQAGALRASSAVNAPEAGAGLARLERSVSELGEPATLRGLVDTPAWRTLDEQARVVDRRSLSALTDSINRSDR